MSQRWNSLGLFHLLFILRINLSKHGRFGNKYAFFEFSRHMIR